MQIESSCKIQRGFYFCCFFFRFSLSYIQYTECKKIRFYMYTKNETFFCLCAPESKNKRTHTLHTTLSISMGFFSQCDYYLKTIPIKNIFYTLYSVGFSHETISVGSDWSSKDDVTIPLLAHFRFFFFSQLNTSFVRTNIYLLNFF